MNLVSLYMDFIENTNPQMPKYQEFIITRLLSDQSITPPRVIPKQNHFGKKSNVTFIDESIGKEP